MSDRWRPKRLQRDVSARRARGLLDLPAPRPFEKTVYDKRGNALAVVPDTSYPCMHGVHWRTCTVCSSPRSPR